MKRSQWVEIGDKLKMDLYDKTEYLVTEVGKSYIEIKNLNNNRITLLGDGDPQHFFIYKISESLESETII